MYNLYMQLNLEIIGEIIKYMYRFSQYSLIEKNLKF